MNKHIVIVALGVTGTTVLYDHFLNNRTVYRGCIKEPLNDKTSKNANIIRNILDTKHWYKDYIEHYIKEAEAEGKCLVIHIKPMHLERLNVSPQDFVEIMKDKFNFVFVKRDNYLNIVIGSKAKNAYRISKEAGTPAEGMPEKLFVPTEDLLYGLEQIDRRYREYGQALYNVEKADISYEREIDVDVKKAADKVAKKYGFYHEYNYAPVNSTHFAVKKNKWSELPLKDKLENYDEVVETLAGTNYEWMLRG